MKIIQGPVISRRALLGGAAGVAAGQGMPGLWRPAGAETLAQAAAAQGVTGQSNAGQGIITSHGYSFFGDLKYPADFKHFDYVRADAPKGGKFSTWAFGTFDSLTPFIFKGNPAIGASIFFDTLMVGNLDEPDSMYGLLAQSIEYPESGEWAIFHLRPEATFRDGSPVRAEDVKFSFEVLRDKGKPSYKLAFRDVASAEVIDPLTVRFVFNKTGSIRDRFQTAAGLPVMSKAYYDTRDFENPSLEAPLGSGPYDLREAIPGQMVAYKRRPDYWAADLPVNVGQNNFDVLSFEYFADYTVAFEAFKGGSYLYREEFYSKIWATGYEFPNVKKGFVKLEELPDGRPAGTQGFFFNLRKAKFADPRVREAIGLAFNFEWSNQSLFYGLYERTDSFWENSELQADGVPKGREREILESLGDLIPAEVLTVTAHVPPPSNADVLADRKNLLRASQLLTDAGWIVGKDGLRRNAEGDVLEVEFMNESPSSERIIDPYVDNLRRIGVIATANRIDPAQMELRVKNFDFDITSERYAMSLTPGIELQQIFGSKSADVPGSQNLAGLKNPAVDALLGQIENARTREDLNASVRALDRVLRSLHIWVPQWHKAVHNIAYYDVFDRPYTDNPPRESLGEMSIWWYDEKKAARLKAAGIL